MPTRRQYIVGSIATLGASGALAQAGGNAAAASVNSIDIDDATFQADDGQLHSPWLDVSAAFEYRNADDAGEVRGLLMVGPEADRELLDMQTVDGASGSDDGTISLRGAVVDSRHFDSSDFDVAEPGGSVSVDIPLAVRVEVRDADGSGIVTAEASTTVTVTTEHAGAEPEVSVQVSGNVEFQESESDPSPV